MNDPIAQARAVLDEARGILVANVRNLTLDEALGAAGGYRSILGILKHTAGWSAVYRSYAFDPQPVPWDQTDWPRGLRDRIEGTTSYLGEVLEWFDRSFSAWQSSLTGADLDEQRPVHWGGTLPLGEILAMVGAHWAYHAGEINAILAIQRQEAWEYGEEVEENHIPTAGHGVRPPWMTDEDVAPWEGE